MLGHLRANLWLLGLTVLVCCVLYPLTLWGVAQLPFFRDQAEGSLVHDRDGKAKGSRLIAQGFSGEEYFQPRPSATAPVPYNAMASTASNLGANNPRLRGRVAQQLGTIVRYHSAEGPGKGALVGADIENWFQYENDPDWGEDRRDLTAEWAADNPSLLADWAKSSDPIKAYLRQWAKDHPGVLAAWKKKNPDSTNPPEPEEVAPFFFDPAIDDSFVNVHPGMWPCTVEEEKDGEKVKVVRPDNKGDDIRSIFFDLWLHDHRDARLELVPADMVMASGSGLDPHITLANALYQAPTVAAARARALARQRGIADNDPRVRDFEKAIHADLVKLLNERAEAPMFGLAGVPLLNVLELNLALPERMEKLADTLR
jgi:K+-transporting ATPase ATPase C chain